MYYNIRFALSLVLYLLYSFPDCSMLEDRRDESCINREEDWYGGPHTSQSLVPSLHKWIILLLVSIVILPISSSSDISLPFNLEQSLARSRFASLSGGLAKTRDIHVFVIKNISEATPIGTVLDTFKAHDKDLPSLNYT